ncbi:MAG TPA: hypothetical protein VK196_06120 [Magnetospirillum sp.]|nr:hypothetical protein [Magnetospirillum sp.]
MAYFTTTAEMEARIADLTDQIQARMQDQPAPDEPAQPMPEGLSATEKMRWAREHQPPVVELQPARPTAAAPTVVPPDVASLRPVDRMRWARGTLVK